MKLRGSALVFSLVVLSFLLISALSVAAISVTNKRSALASKNSTLSFQVADSAAEDILYQIYQVNDPVGGTVSANLTDLAGNLTGANCKTAPTPNVIEGANYVATFYTCTSSASSSCSAISCSSATWRADVTQMKILGTYAGVTRAIEVGITPKP